MRHFLIFLFGLICVINAPAKDEQIKGTVVSVLDGNTLEIKSDDNETVRIFLYGIDCPELGQAFGHKAKKCLEGILLNQQVSVKLIEMDKGGNQYALVTTSLGVDPRIQLLREGLAWTLQESPVPDLEPYRSFAEQKRKGIWKEDRPTPPWIYRREQSMLQPKKS
jgi:endonuclease YncB( thermonuclease family)